MHVWHQFNATSKVQKTRDLPTKQYYTWQTHTWPRPCYEFCDWLRAHTPPRSVWRYLGTLCFKLCLKIISWISYLFWSIVFQQNVNWHHLYKLIWFSILAGINFIFMLWFYYILNAYLDGVHILFTLYTSTVNSLIAIALMLTYKN